jgi:ribosomal protein S16
MNYLWLSIILADNLDSLLSSSWSKVIFLITVKPKKVINLYIYYIEFYVKLRLKKEEKPPSYRLVVMENTCRRDGRPIEEWILWSNLKKYDTDKIQKWLSYGVKPTETALNLLKAKLLIFKY